MYQRLYSFDVHRNIKSYATATFILNCIIGFFVFLISSVVILALLPLYLPFHDFIPTNLDRQLDVYAYCHINNITPSQSNTSTMLIDENDWSDVEQMIQYILNLKLNQIQLTNLSDVRLVDSILSEHVSATWCQTHGCLRVLSKVLFPIDCSLACQLRQMKQFETLNVLEPSIIISLNSILNTTYVIELDGFTVVVIENEENGDEIQMFLMYDLSGKQSRSLSSLSVAVDNSSLNNITYLVNNSIIQSRMNISAFVVICANVNMETLALNVTVRFRFSIKCLTNCQQIQVKKLKNITSISLEPIIIIYDGNVHSHNVSFIDVFDTTSAIIPSSTTEYTLSPIDSTLQTTSSLIIYLAESIFEVFYKLQSYDLIFDGELQSGPIIDSSTIDDLTNLMQTTISNYSNISAIVFNATIEIDNGNSTTRAPSIDSTNYILHLIVYYIYPNTCHECIDISNNAIYTKPEVSNLIQIRNATLIDIPSPFSVINLTSDRRTTTPASINPISMSTGIHTTNQHYTTEHASTSIHSTDHTTLHTSEHTHTTIHSTDHTSQHTGITIHSTEHTSQHTSEHTGTTSHSTDHTSHHTSEHTSTHSSTSSYP